jgi:hypothetical protein
MTVTCKVTPIMGPAPAGPPPPETTVIGGEGTVPTARHAYQEMGT